MRKKLTNKKQVKVYDFEISEYYLTYFINADPSGLSAEDLTLLKQFEERESVSYVFCPDYDSTDFRKCEVSGLLSSTVTVKIEYNIGEAS